MTLFTGKWSLRYVAMVFRHFLNASHTVFLISSGLDASTRLVPLPTSISFLGSQLSAFLQSTALRSAPSLPSTTSGFKNFRKNVHVSSLTLSFSTCTNGESVWNNCINVTRWLPGMQRNVSKPDLYHPQGTALCAGISTQLMGSFQYFGDEALLLISTIILLRLLCNS